jgi:sugar phosphate isomerase/epimerase
LVTTGRLPWKCFAWKNAVDALKAIGYDGTITLEVFCNDSQMLYQYLDLSRKYVQKLWQ